MVVVWRLPLLPHCRWYLQCVTSGLSHGCQHPCERRVWGCTAVINVARREFICSTPRLAAKGIELHQRMLPGRGVGGRESCFVCIFFFLIYFFSLIQSHKFERRIVAKWAGRGISLISMTQHRADSLFCPQKIGDLTEGRGSKLSPMMEQDFTEHIRQATID